MKTYHIEIQRVKALRHEPGLIDLQVDAQVLPQSARDDAEPSTRLTLSEDNARVLYTLLRQQLSELDRRKGRSQR
jgi:hypothetical protein